MSWNSGWLACGLREKPFRKKNEKKTKICLTCLVGFNKHGADKSLMGVPQRKQFMKRIVISLGLVAVGASVVQAAPYSLSSMQSSKAWSVGASLRGFYDDNYTLASSHEQDSFGFVVSPTIGINLPMEQTLLTADYIYSMYYYDARKNDKIDQNHQFVLSLSHSFSERYSLELKDSFVVAQEPSLIDPSIVSYPGRANGNNIRNTGSARFHAELTRQLGLVVGYGNTFYDYENSGGNYNHPSLSGLMDRMEQSANIDLRWLMARNTTGIIGYQFSAVDYTQNEQIGASLVGTPGWQMLLINHSTDRNNYSHFVYAGVDQVFNEQLSGNLRAGVQLTDYYNDPHNTTETLSPYVEASLAYAYAAGSSAQLGFRHARNQTDVVSAFNGQLTQDQESSVVFASINHQITPKLIASLLGSVQWSTFNGGSQDGKTDTYYSVGPTLTYNFNQHLSADISYNYTMLDSGIAGRDYARNQIFLGITAAY
jgi:Putative beta-barrel porin 2